MYTNLETRNPNPTQQVDAAEKMLQNIRTAFRGVIQVEPRTPHLSTLNATP